MPYRYYLIRPKSALLEILKDYDPVYFASWREGHIWGSDEHPHHVREIDKARNTLIAKLAFLYGHTFYSVDPEVQASYSKLMLDFGVSLETQKRRDEEHVSLIHQMFGTPPKFNLINFDQWWTIEQFGPGGSVDKTFKEATVERLSQLEAISEPTIAGWLENLITYSRHQEAKSDTNEDSTRFDED